MLIPGLVVFRRPPHLPLARGLGVQWGLGPPGRDLLDQVQKRATVAIGHLLQRVPRRAGQGQPAIQLLFGALGQVLQIAQRQAFQHQNLRPAQQGCVQLE